MTAPNRSEMVTIAVYQGIGTGIGLFVAQLLISLVQSAG